jgi:hypothetical protein
MTIAKETAIAVPALGVLLFVSHVFFGPDESYREFTTGPTSWLGAAIPAERFIAKDPITGRASGADTDANSLSLEQRRVGNLTPEARIRSVFAQFLPNGRRPTT